MPARAMRDRSSGVPRRARLRLDREQRPPAQAEDETFARTMARKPSPVRDPGGGYAWWDSAAGSLQAAGFAPGAVAIPIPPDTPPGVPQPTDLAFGTDDVLYVARNDGVVMLDRRERWRPARVDLDGFRAHLLSPAAGGGVWALDRLGRRLARLSGYPLRTGGIIEDTGEIVPSDRAEPATRRGCVSIVRRSWRRRSSRLPLPRRPPGRSPCWPGGRARTRSSSRSMAHGSFAASRWPACVFLMRSPGWARPASQ